MKHRRFFLLCLLTLFVSSFSVASANAWTDNGLGKSKVSDRSAAEVFPASTIGYVEVQPPANLVNLLLNHPLREKFESLPQIKAGLKSKEFAGFLAGVGFVQFYTGMEWEESLDTLAGRGFAFGFDPESQAAGAVFLSAHPDKLPKLYKGLLRLANQNNKNTVQEGKYRDLKAYSIGKQVYLIPVEDRVFVSNKKPMVKQMVDYWLDKTDSNLSKSSSFAKAKSAAGNKTVWAYGDLKAIRNAGLAKELFQEKTENIGAELIVGGVLEALRSSDDLSASVSLENDRIEFSIQTSFDAASVPEQRTYFFGTQKERDAFERLKLDNTLGEIFAFRDVGKLWLSKEDLFDENHLSELSQADSTISTLFSGLDLGEEILGSAEPGFQLIARNQNYENLETPKPDIKVPEFALVFRLKKSDRIQRRFRVAYQSFVGFLNIQLAMQGNPQLELESEKVGDARIVSATYLADEDKEYDGLINYNFSPTIAFAGKWFVISSTKQLAADLVDAGKNNRVTTSPSTNTSFRVFGKQARKILTQNAEQLIAQNMLEEGNDRDEAKAQIDLLLNLVGLVKETSLELKQGEKSLSLDFRIGLDAKAAVSNSAAKTDSTK